MNARYMLVSPSPGAIVEIERRDLTLGAESWSTEMAGFAS